MFLYIYMGKICLHTLKYMYSYTFLIKKIKQLINLLLEIISNLTE